MLDSIGLDSADEALVKCYIRHYEQWTEASKQVEKMGLVIEGKSGILIVNPWGVVQRQQTEILKKLTSELGLSPGCRKRLKMDSVVGNDDDFYK